MIDSGLPKSGVFVDLFSGTGSVAKYFKDKGYSIISNDIMTYSYIAQYTLVKINTTPKFLNVSKSGLQGVLNILNEIKPIKGYVYENYAPSGRFGRQYFSNSNAMKIDAIRERIEYWYKHNKINTDEYNILLYSFLDAADFIANISGTYGAYLKIWRSTALKNINLKTPNISNNEMNNKVFKDDANILAKKISGDIVYLDPPYNERQYAPNFHVLESLAIWDKQDLKGKTGQRDYSGKKSAYSQKTKACKAFEELIKSLDTKYIVLSYNNEGIIPKEFIVSTLKKRGDVKEYIKKYRRFRTERDHDKRQYKNCNDEVFEHLFILKIKK